MPACCKLYYFQARGRGEPIRLCLVHAGVDFEDIRFSWEEWPEYQKLSPLGKCPFLEIDGEKIAQTDAILKFVAKRFGVYGGAKDAMGEAKVDMLACQVNDLMFTITPFYIKMVYEKKPEEAIAFLKGCNEPQIQPQLKVWDGLLAKSSFDFLCANEPTYADFGLWHLVDTLRKFEPLISENIASTGHENLTKFCERIENLSRVKEYLANRPKYEPDL